MGDDKMMTQEEIRNARIAWGRGNDKGKGFAVGDYRHTPTQAILYDGGEVIAVDNDGFAVGELHGETIAVADHNGPWAVTL
jgi:hypothetical protein